MKYKLLFLSFAFIAIAFTSCKKKYAGLEISGASKTFQSGNTVDFGTNVKSSKEEDNRVDFVVESTGTKEINISSLELSGTDASMFTLDKKNFNTGVLDMGKTQTFSISLKTATSGTYDASLVIKSDAKDQETYTLNLTGVVQ